jgi:hypothetical protein
LPKLLLVLLEHRPVTGSALAGQPSIELSTPSVQQRGGGKVVKTAISSLTLALALIVTPAAAQSTSAAAAAAGERLLPPKEFDHPFAGKLIVLTAFDQDDVRRLCPDSKFSPTIGALGCAPGIGPKRCRIVLAPDADIIKAGFPPELVKRHEIAHCKGWPADHRGALPYEEWASDTAVKTAASQFDKFATGAVGKTVAEIAKVVDILPSNPGRPFSLAAEGLGLTPESKITGAILSNPATAGPLAKAAGIGRDLSADEWVEAHALAFYAAKGRQARNAAAASQSVPNLGQAAPQPQQAQPAAARATTDVVCGVVLNTPDGFLAVRERPGTQTRMTAKLRPGQSVNISSEDCVWQSNGNVTCNKWIMVSGSDGTPASGWVRSKYLQPSDC